MDKETLKVQMQARVTELKANGTVALATIKDRSNNDIVLEQIKLDNDNGFFLQRINCMKASKYNLGDCVCGDHVSEVSTPLIASQVFDRLSTFVRKALTDATGPTGKKKKTEAEIAALDEQIELITNPINDGSAYGKAKRAAAARAAKDADK